MGKSSQRHFVRLFTFTILFLSLTTAKSEAGFFTLPQLDTSQTDPIFRTLAASFAFRPFEPASDLGPKFGLYFGVTGGGVDGSQVASIFQGTSIPYFPFGEAGMGIGLPAGIVLEAGMIPTLSFSGTTFSKYAGGIKWTITRTLLSKLPLSLAAQLTYSKGTVTFSQPLQSGTVNVNYGTSVAGFNVVAGKKLSFFEPYIGLGVINHSSNIDSSGTANLFGSTFPVGTQNYSGSTLSIWPQIGFLLKLAILGIGVEYDYMFGLSTLGAKASFRF